MKKTVILTVLLLILTGSLACGETQQERVKRNWAQLKAGLTYEEVDKLVGPVCGEHPEVNKACNELRVATMGKGVESRIQTAYYLVVFDKNGRLKVWQQK